MDTHLGMKEAKKTANHVFRLLRIALSVQPSRATIQKAYSFSKNVEAM